MSTAEQAGFRHACPACGAIPAPEHGACPACGYRDEGQPPPTAAIALAIGGLVAMVLGLLAFVAGLAWPAEGQR